jgi:hypothetical protein
MNIPDHPAAEERTGEKDSFHSDKALIPAQRKLNNELLEEGYQ